MKFKAGLDEVTSRSNGEKVLGGFYKAEGETPRPTAVLRHGLPGIEDIACELRDRGWNFLYFHFRGCEGSRGKFSPAGSTDDTRGAMESVRKHPSVDNVRLALVGGSTGLYPALLHAAAEPGIRAVVGIHPLVRQHCRKLESAWKLLPLSTRLVLLVRERFCRLRQRKMISTRRRCTRIQSLGLPVSNGYKTKKTITNSAPAAGGRCEP